ncbi:MAG TPA: hypothetical protein VGE00_08755 [Gammaproteobacteria bacterium]
MESDYLLGITSGNIALRTIEQNRTTALALAQQAHHYLQIATRDMDALLYDNEPFIDALTALARRHAKSHIDILVWDSTAAVKQGHRLINLAQRLSSYVQIRKPSDEHAKYTEAFLVADGVGYMSRNLAERYEGIASFHAPLQARNLSQLFTTMWEKSLPDSQLRRLHI